MGTGTSWMWNTVLGQKQYNMPQLLKRRAYVLSEGDECKWEGSLDDVVPHFKAEHHSAARKVYFDNNEAVRVANVSTKIVYRSDSSRPHEPARRIDILVHADQRHADGDSRSIS